MVKRTFKTLIKKAKQNDAYWVGKVTNDFTEDLFRLMEIRNVSKKDLADRIGSSPAYITKILRGNTNFTVESMIKLVRALDGQLCIHVGKNENRAVWFDIEVKNRKTLKNSSGDYGKNIIKLENSTVINTTDSTYENERTFAA